MFHKLRSMHNRVTLFVSALIMVLSGPVLFGASHAYAIDPNGTYSTCNVSNTGVTACLNAWGGGPFVNVSTNDDTANDAFAIIAGNSGNEVSLDFDIYGSGGWSNTCVGDAYDMSDNNTTSLDVCPGVGSPGWGTSFTATTCTNSLGAGYIFKNTHWNKYLAPLEYSNGVSFWLDNSTPQCFAQVNAIN